MVLNFLLTSGSRKFIKIHEKIRGGFRTWLCLLYCDDVMTVV
jgi:hypothetical protein